MIVAEKRWARPDALAKVTGEALYTADLRVPGMLHAAFVYPPHVHARIRAIDAIEAERIPGVYAVVTQRDVPLERYGMLIQDRTLFAHEIVRFEGEIVAGVAAATPAIARQAAALIRVDYDPLDPVLDPEVALLADGALVHADWLQYESLPVVRDGNACAHPKIVKGDVERGLAEADEIITERYTADVTHPAPIEPHAVLAQWDGDELTVHSSTQVPFTVRAGVAKMLRMPERNVRVVVSCLGGGFGGKCDMHFEAHVAVLAKKAGRPVRLVLDRREEFVATDMTRHGITVELTTGVMRTGEIVARKARIVLDGGAYAGHTPAIADIATMIAAGPYRIPNLHIEAQAVYTHRTPAGSTRGPSGPQVCWALEQHTDVVAERIGLDPVGFRLQNVVVDGDEGPTGQIHDGVAIKGCIERAAELIDRRRECEPGEGVGLSCGWWFSFPLPSGASLKIDGDGGVTIITGAQENGSGAVMGLALIVAKELGIDPSDVAISYQDTGIAPYDWGSGGSQTTFNNGRAVVGAAHEVRRQLFELAEGELEAAAADLELAEGQVRVIGSPDKAVAISALAQKAFGMGKLVAAIASPVAPAAPEYQAATCVGRVFMQSFAAPSFFCHAARVHVDADSGVVRVLEVVTVHDVGHIVNPAGAIGQIEGGVVHGLGIALSEGTVFQNGRQANANLLDYKLQTIADAPAIHVEFVNAHAPNGGPYGAKGVGEPPVVPTAGAVANAIADATKTRVRRLPMTPVRVWDALREAHV